MPRELALINNIEQPLRAPRLSEVLFDRRQNSFASIAALPSNVEAIEAALLFSTGLASFVALVGPSGWGKSHLLEAVSSRLGHDACPAPSRLELSTYLMNPLRFEQSRVLILDDVQDVLAKSKLRQSLRFNLERRVRGGKATILAFTSPKATRQIRALLPNQREWNVASIGAPEPAERVLLINQMSAAEGLALCPRLAKIIAYQMHGNGRTLSGALKRLRLTHTNWLDTRSTLRACGLLEPFFADNGSWDLKHKILRVAEQQKGQFAKLSSTDLAIHTMLSEAGLAEVDVARAVSIEPAEAYVRSSRFRKTVEEDHEVNSYVRQFMEHVVQSLAQD